MQSSGKTEHSWGKTVSPRRRNPGKPRGCEQRTRLRNVRLLLPSHHDICNMAHTATFPSPAESLLVSRLRRLLILVVALVPPLRVTFLPAPDVVMVGGISFSPDGGAWPRSESGRLGRQLRQRARLVEVRRPVRGTVDVRADGSAMAVHASGGKFNLLDPADGRVRATFNHHARALVFSPTLAAWPWLTTSG